MNFQQICDLKLSFLRMLETFTLFFYLRLFSKVFDLSTPVQRQLQGVSCTISWAHDMVTGLRDLLTTWSSEEYAMKFYGECTTEAASLKLEKKNCLGSAEPGANLGSDHINLKSAER